MRFGNVVVRSALVAVLGLLAGCHTAKQLANCPSASILANTSRLTSFKKGLENDPSGEVYSVEITGVTAVCDFDKYEGTTDNNIEISFRATRPPNGAQADFTVPYYLATMLDGNKILSKQILATTFSFGPGESTTTFSAQVPSTLIHLENGKKPYEYGLLVGLQLTREQLDYAGTHGRYAP